MSITFYTLNAALLLSGFLAVRLNSGDRRFSLALIQALFGIFLLAGEYLYLAYHVEVQIVRLVLVSEIVFALIWLTMVLRLGDASLAAKEGANHNFVVEIVVGLFVIVAAGYYLGYQAEIKITHIRITFQSYSPVYFSAVFMLLTVLYVSWRLEQFWRKLSIAQRWEYKHLLSGSYLVSGALAWSASYRLTYLAVATNHLVLLTVLLCVGVALMSYAVVHHRLLNRKIFVSRKVIYSFVVPSLLSAYLLGFGIVSLIMRTFGLEMSYVLKWLFLVLGSIAVVIFGSSGRIRSRLHFFISTHFYINKYEYRDEWLALSQNLQGALTELEVVKALRRVLVTSLYTTKIYIWLGDRDKGYTLVVIADDQDDGGKGDLIAANDPLVQFLKTHSYFHIRQKETDSSWRSVVEIKKDFFTTLDLILVAPLAIGSQLVGMIGLGPEYTGGQYGHDDFDLLSVLGSQTASALLAVRMAEELAHAREQQAWNRLSTFVLHDIKNAATMLSLLQENAPGHIHEAEFQRDMLELVTDALKRMGRVEQRLRSLKDEILPEWQSLELYKFLQDCNRRLAPKLFSLAITLEKGEEIWLETDPVLLFSVMENILLNASQAKGKGAVVHIKFFRDDNTKQAIIEILDNGPGIADDLLPDTLFEQFKTSKEGGCGIGLWQVKRVVSSLGGDVYAENRSAGGCFIIKLPLA